MSTSVAASAQNRELISPGALPLSDTASVRTEGALCLRQETYRFGYCYYLVHPWHLLSCLAADPVGDGRSLLPRALSSALDISPRVLINWGGEFP